MGLGIGRKASTSMSLARLDKPLSLKYYGILFLQTSNLSRWVARGRINWKYNNISLELDFGLKADLRVMQSSVKVAPSSMVNLKSSLQVT